MPTYLLGLAAVVALSGCTVKRSDLFGHYEVVGEDQGATLDIEAPNRYRFCYVGKCSDGTFKFGRELSEGVGRITFDGAELENYIISFHQRQYGPSKVYEQRGRWQSIDLTYELNLPGPLISVDAGSETAFMKR